MKEMRKTESTSGSSQEGTDYADQEILLVRHNRPNAIGYIECVRFPGVRWITSGFPDLETREEHFRKLGMRFVEPEEAENIRAEKRQTLKQQKKEER